MSTKFKNSSIYLLILFIAFFYFYFPTNNSTLDAYAYAGSVKYGESLFSSHHLLYNSFLYSIVQPLIVILPKLDVLYASKVVNSMFLILNLFIFYDILRKLNFKRKEIFLYVLIAGFSFNSWRFGTENEAYVIPITFSLLGSLFFFNYLQSKHIKFIFLSGFFAAIACLFHQIHFFWWFALLLGLALYVKRFKPIFVYAISALLVPLVYFLVIVYYNNQTLSFDSILHFVFYDYYSGSAKSEFGWLNLILIGINSVRTFFQVHPNIYFLIKKNIFFSVPILVFLYFLYVFIKQLYKKELFKKRKDINKVFYKTHLLVLILQYAFAFYSVGNVEFLVMLPFLLLLSVFYFYQVNYQVLVWFSLTLFIWNFSYGIYPNNQYKYYNDEVLVNFIIEHPNDFFLVKESALLNKYFYATGVDDYDKIILYDKTDSVTDIHAKKNYIYTDIIDRPTIFNRAVVVSLNETKYNLDNFKKEIIFYYDGFYGKTAVYKVCLK